MRRRLASNAQYVRDGLRKGGIDVPDTPGPVIVITPQSGRETARLKRRLLEAGILPPFMKYPGGPESGCLRFAISSEHSREQLKALVDALVAAT
jgi:7-keto-8-aminopelargonate synthetase-like enzyme